MAAMLVASPSRPTRWGKRTTHAYDPVGNRTTTTDRLGRIRQFAYDADDRLVTEAWKPVGGGATIRTVTWTYDDAGRLTSVKDPDSQYAYAYDDANRLTGVDNAGSPGMPSVALTYTYDPAGNRTAVQDSLGGRTSYAYDVRNWLTDITQSGTGVAPKRVDFAYDAAGRRTGLTRFSDLAGSATVLVTAYTYDDADRLTNLTHKTAGGTTRASYGYTLDAASRLTSEARTWTTAGGTASDTVGYTYTADDQLTGVTHSNGSFAAESFGYDANGNRNTAGYGTTTGNRLAAAPGSTYAHDAEGNRTSVTETATGKVTTYAYDHRDRLTGATIKDASGSVLARTTYTYDALDRRIKVAAGANVLKVVYDGQATLLDFDGGNAEVARYLQGPAIDEVLARETGAGNAVAWYLQDRLGTVRDIADNTGAVVDHLGYDAFGAVTIETDPGYGGRFKFTGRELDPVTGLYYYRARWYDATAGRFLGEDPSGFEAGDSNLYRYVGNDPTNEVDPSGLEPPNKSTVVDISTGVVTQVNKQTSYPPVTLPGTSNPMDGPCASFAKRMTDALKAKNIPSKLHFYHITPGTFTYTFPNGKQVPVELGRGDHVRVEVDVKNGDKTETISLDAGICPAGALSLGNLGDYTTGVIAPENLKPKDTNTGKPILTPFNPPK